MTFTFTIDAFPDYTKFDRTHKVLAALQVITDKDNNNDETRQPCVSNEDSKTVQVTGDNLDVVFSFDNDSTEEAVKITVGGVNVDGTKYDKEAGWPDIAEKGGRGVTVDVKVHDIDPKTKDYYVVMINPVYGKYIDKADGDGNTSQYIGDGIRKATYKAGQVPGWEADHAFSVLVTDLPGDINYKIYEKAASGALTLVQTIDVKNEVSFKPKDD